MSVFFRPRDRAVRPDAEQRATLSQLPRNIVEQLLGIRSNSYADVDLSRAESSLQSVAVGSAVDLLASTASELPFDIFRGRGLGREQVPVSRVSWIEDPDGSGHGFEDFTYRLMFSWLLRGNSFGDTLDVGQGGAIRQVDLFHPDEVRGDLDQGAPVWTVNGREVRRMHHRRVNPVPGWVLGLSPVAWRMHMIGLNVSSTRFGLNWFQEGAHPSGVLSNSEAEINGEQAQSIKDRFMNALRGTREPVVLGRGWQWNQLQINPDESQFLETQKFSAAECARMFGPGIAEILGYETGGTLTYSNIQERDLHVLKYAFNRWLRRLERFWFDWLPRPLYLRYNRDALLETSTVQRYMAHASALDKQWKTVNEVRRLEDLEPVPWGDEPVGLPAAEPDSEPADEGDEPEGEL